VESVFTFATHLLFLADIFLADMTASSLALGSTYDAFLMHSVVEPGGGNPTLGSKNFCRVRLLSLCLKEMAHSRSLAE